MKKQIFGICILGLVFGFGGIAQAKEIYVDKSSVSPVAPFTNLVNAAHSIQGAIDVSVDGDVVILLPDTYAPSAELVITNNITLRSWTLQLEDADQTVISGSGSHRVLNLGANACEVIGLTIQNGNGSNGGGIYCADNTPLVWNCVIEQNTGGSSGGGMYKGTASNCIFTNNSGYYGGATRDTILKYCTVIDNKATRCGGIYGGTAYECEILNNEGIYDLGGVYSSSITNCMVIGNLSPGAGGGLYSSTAIGSVIAGNHAGTEGGGSYNSTLTHCTVTGNSAVNKGGGARGGTIKNSIIWNNTAREGDNCAYESAYASCSPDFTPGSNGCITNNPQLVSISHLGAGSPCLNTGDATYSVGGDIDGQNWNTPPSMGCDERYSGAVTGEMSPFNDLSERVVVGEEIYFQARVDGPALQTVLDFGDGTSVTNFTETTLSHTWAYGNFHVILTGFNDESPYRTSITNTVYVRPDSSTTIYVSTDGSDSADGESWATAKKTIQAGIDAQIWESGLVLVSNGTYSIDTEIFITKSIRVQGLDGAENCIVKGNNHQRCFTLYNSDCTLKDLTIRDGGGYAQGPSGGGAIRCSGLNPTVESCILTENNTANGGGAMYRGTATNCTFKLNTGGNGPAGMEAGVAIDCLFEQNISSNGAGGIEDGVATRCIFKANKGTYGGGARNSHLFDCQFLFNENVSGSGGGMVSGTAENCVFRGNKSLKAGGGSYNGTATHCTYTDNKASTLGGGSYGTTLDHCISWYNTAMGGMDNIAYSTVTDSCSPDLTHGTSGNITSNPQLVSASHISLNSPCAGSGSLVSNTLDIDGDHWRISPAMGCDEPWTPFDANEIRLSIDGPTDIPAGYKAFFNIDIQGAFDHDRIVFGDGQSAINTAINPIYHTWTTPGTYNMIVSTYNENGQVLRAKTHQVTVHAADFNTIYVAPNGDDDANGRSWLFAKQTIQAAIDEQELPGGQVVVSNGVYILTETVKIHKDIQLIGFNGATNTVIDAGSLPNYQHSRGMEIGDNHSTVDGFTIRNASYSWTGGGIWCNNTFSPIISNCILENNKAGTAGGMYGGTVVDCVFSNNQATAGAGGGLYQGTAQRCQFIENTARDGGGGMYGGTAYSCTFKKNSSNGYGGGMYKGDASDCTFIENESFYGGAGMAEGIANDCTFIKNAADQPGGGMTGGTANRCAFIQNRSILTTGGGMNSGTANACYFTGNRANTDGGATSYTTLNNCTVTGNSAEVKAGGCLAGNVNNSIVWNNTAGESDNELFSAHPKFTCSPDAPHGTDGCITNNPLLVSASHISAASPCFGAGSPLYATGTDIDGESWNQTYSDPAMGCDEFTGSLTGSIDMDFFGPSPIRASTVGNYIAFFDGPVSKTIVDFGHTTPLTNSVGSISHRWPGPAAGNYDVILTAFNDDFPLGTSFTQRVEVVDSASDQHVWSIGDDLADGLTWATAKQTIQAGIDAQNICNGKVLVDANTYAIADTLIIDKPIYLLGYNADGNNGLTPVVDAGSSNRCFDVAAVDCTIDNFIIQNGAASTLGYSNNKGGGIRCKTTDPIIKYTTLSDCTAYYGGAAYKGTLHACTFDNNTATSYGGAIYGSEVWNSNFDNNSATNYGGGASHAILLADCTFSTNSAKHGGAAYSSTLTNCTLVSNSAISYGGGTHSCNVTASTINGNTAQLGGGLFSSTIDRCVISTNNATQRGGGSDGGTAHNCVYEWNSTPGQGGGTYGTKLYNCTVVSNAADVAGGSFGAYAYNSIFWDNGAWTDTPNIQTVYLYDSCSPEATPGQHGNITNAPLFVAYPPGFFTRGSDYYLSALSPCLNAGNNSHVQTERDFNGWDRILYNTVDMGANEMYFFDSDNDGDDMPDGWELENFGGTTNAVAGADADGDAFDNRSEYIAGTDPNDDTAYLRIIHSEIAETDPLIGMLVEWSPSVEGRIYGISWTTNLTEGFQADDNATLPYPFDSYIIRNTEPNAYYKINVRLAD